MAEHDQRFKTLLRVFFEDFLRLFFPDRAAGLDFSRLTWLDKEVFPDPLHGEALVMDLVAQLPFLGGGDASSLALVHIEVESRDSVAPFRQRMHDYYHALRARHPDVPILPVALYLRVGLEGLGVDTYVEKYEDLEVNRFRFLYVGFPALDGLRYVEGDNSLGVALSSLTRVSREQKPFLRVEGLRRLVNYTGDEARRLLLVEAFDAYAGLEEAQRPVYEELLRRDEYQEVRPVMQSMYQQGIAEGRRVAFLDALEAKFGPLPEEVAKKVAELTGDEIRDLWRKFVDARTLDDLGLRGETAAGGTRE